MTDRADVVSLCGSPRWDGFSSRLHDEFLEPVLESGLSVERVYAYDGEFNPCIACGHCRDAAECVFSDSMEPLCDFLVNAPGISISSPVYFSSLPGPLKCIIDRCQVIWEMARRSEDINEKTAFLIMAGGGEYGTMFDSSLIIMKHFSKILNCAFDSGKYIGIDKTDDLASLSSRELSAARDRGREFASEVLRLKRGERQEE